MLWGFLESVILFWYPPNGQELWILEDPSKPKRKVVGDCLKQRIRTRQYIASVFYLLHSFGNYNASSFHCPKLKPDREHPNTYVRSRRVRRLGGYSSNIGVLLLNKYLLTNYGFKYPIFLTLCHMAVGLMEVVLAFLMINKREEWVTYSTLIPVVAGVIVASGGEPSFHLLGFIMCVTATAARAFKSVLQEILLSSDGEKLNSMNLLLYMAPIAVICLLPATILMERNVIWITLELARKDTILIWYLLFNSSLAYFVNLTNFLVTKHTSVLTLQVLGNDAKGAVAVVVSILIFKNPISFMGMLGYGLTVVGVILYSEAKKRYSS